MSREFKVKGDLLRQEQKRIRAPEDPSLAPCLLLSFFRSPVIKRP